MRVSALFLFRASGGRQIRTRVWIDGLGSCSYFEFLFLFRASRARFVCIFAAFRRLWRQSRIFFVFSAPPAQESYVSERFGALGTRIGCIFCSVWPLPEAPSGPPIRPPRVPHSARGSGLFLFLNCSGVWRELWPRVSCSYEGCSYKDGGVR